MKRFVLILVIVGLFLFAGCDYEGFNTADKKEPYTKYRQDWDIEEDKKAEIQEPKDNIPVVDDNRSAFDYPTSITQEIEDGDLIFYIEDADGLNTIKMEIKDIRTMEYIAGGSTTYFITIPSEMMGGITKADFIINSVDMKNNSKSQNFSVEI